MSAPDYALADLLYRAADACDELADMVVSDGRNSPESKRYRRELQADAQALRAKAGTS